MMLVLQVVLALRPDLTPGAVRLTSADQVCARAWQPSDSRLVSNALWQQVLTRYHVPWTDKDAYTATLVVPTALGGVVVVENVAPFAKASVWNATRKTTVEQRVFTELCAGRLHLDEAQNKAGLQWVTTWRIYFAP